jgi:hypothetical protein
VKLGLQKRCDEEMDSSTTTGTFKMPLKVAHGPSVLPFIRFVEELSLENKLRPLLIYWSRYGAANLLPSPARYRELQESALSLAVFSEERSDPPDEWAVLLQSQKLSAIVHGQQIVESDNKRKYQCSGSLDLHAVQEAYERLLPIFETIDPTEAGTIKEANAAIDRSISELALVQQLQSAWMSWS